MLCFGCGLSPVKLLMVFGPHGEVFRGWVLTLTAVYRAEPYGG